MPASTVPCEICAAHDDVVAVWYYGDFADWCRSCRILFDPLHTLPVWDGGLAVWDAAWGEVLLVVA